MVAPHSEALVPGQSTEHSSNQARWVITERPQLQVGRSLVELSHPTLPVRVLNPSNEVSKVKKGDELAIGEPVLSVHLHQKPESCTQPTVLPPHVAELYTRSTKELQSTQSEEIHNLLLQYADVFSRGPDDLGQTSLVKHTINTGTAPAIKNLHEDSL